ELYPRLPCLSVLESTDCITGIPGLDHSAPSCTLQRNLHEQSLIAVAATSPAHLRKSHTASFINVFGPFSRSSLFRLAHRIALMGFDSRHRIGYGLHQAGSHAHLAELLSAL